MLDLIIIPDEKPLNHLETTSQDGSSTLVMHQVNLICQTWFMWHKMTPSNVNSFDNPPRH